MAQPRWETPRRTERETYGARKGEVAKRLGTPYMWWQQKVADVAGEIDPETGRLAYREVICTVMRQQGKTVWVFSEEIDRGLMWGSPQRIIYTAQTGSDARRKLLEDQVPILQRSGLKSTVSHIHRAQGNENVLFKTGSRISIAASSQNAGHGFTVDLGVLDECWADEDDRREQALLPAMVTRPEAQLLVVSTMGTDHSAYLNRKVEAGRAAAKEDLGHGIAYFEWSIPLDADIENPEVWWEHMPALGWTVTEDAVRHAFQTMPEAEWRRAYGNQPTKCTNDQAIPDSLWRAVVFPKVEVDRSIPVSIGIDVLPDRQSGAMVASDGKTIELIDHQAGTGWIVDRAKEVSDRFAAEFVIDAGGPAVSLLADLENAGLDVVKYGTPELAAAAGGMFDAIADRKTSFREDASFDAAISGLQRRPVGDRFVWDRSNSGGDITPLVAATLAYDRAAHGGQPVQFIRLDD